MPDLNIKDTINIPDTTTLQSVVSTNALRFEGEPIARLPHNESWIFGVVFVFFIFFIFSLNRSYSWIEDSLKNITKVKSRNSLFSKTTAEEYQSRFLLVLFSVGVITLYLYLTFFPTIVLNLKVYALLFLSSLTFLFLKQMLSKTVAYTFLNKELFKIGSENFYNTLSFSGILLFPLLILKIYFYDGLNVKLFDIIALIFTFSALIFLTVKYFQIFYRKILDFFHILLYLCTLEILPLIGMYQVYKWIIKEF